MDAGKFWHILGWLDKDGHFWIGQTDRAVIGEWMGVVGIMQV